MIRFLLFYPLPPIVAVCATDLQELVGASFLIWGGWWSIELIARWVANVANAENKRLALGFDGRRQAEMDRLKRENTRYKAREQYADPTRVEFMAAANRIKVAELREEIGILRRANRRMMKDLEELSQ